MAVLGRDRCPSVARFVLLGYSSLVALMLMQACASTECSFNSQCGDKRYCEDGICRQDCAEDQDCTTGMVCNPIGRCTPPYDAGPIDSGPVTTPDSGPIVRDSGPVIRDAGFDAGRIDSGPRDAGHDASMPRGYLDDCTASPQCESSTCIPENGSNSNVCSKTCNYDTDCADWHYCLHAGAGEMGVCVYDDTGRACNSMMSGGDCEFACLFPSQDQPAGHCTHICEDASDCPGGYACTLSDPTDSSSVKVCGWIHKSCPNNQDECPTGLGGCGFDPGSQCTGACTSDADCPQVYEGSYRCGSISGVTFNICIPEYAWDGATGQVCTSGEDCRSGICRQFPGSSVSICSERCNPTGGCPEGFGCNAFSVGGSAALLCAPAGEGRSGEACSGNSDCRSAFCSPTTHTCVDFCQNNYCPDGFTCRSDSYVVDGISLRSCRQ